MNNPPGRAYRITIGGETYSVEVVTVGARSAQVRVNGRLHEIEFKRDEEKGARDAAVQAPIPPQELQREGPEDEPIRSGSPERILVAPMPGDILDVKVHPGERVTLGQELFVLEAMKMKSAIRSAREGIVESVQVQEGQSVAYGQPLLTYE